MLSIVDFDESALLVIRLELAAENGLSLAWISLTIRTCPNDYCCIHDDAATAAALYGALYEPSLDTSGESAYLTIAASSPICSLFSCNAQLDHRSESPIERCQRACWQYNHHSRHRCIAQHVLDGCFAKPFAGCSVRRTTMTRASSIRRTLRSRGCAAG